MFWIGLLVGVVGTGIVLVFVIAYALQGVVGR